MAVSCEFVNIFRRNWKDKNYDELERLFKEAPRYLQNLLPSQIGPLLEELVADDGLPKFLRDSINQVRFSSSYDSSTREGFYLLKYLFTTFSENFHPYLRTTATICELGIKFKISHYTKRAACHVFISLTRTFPEFSAGFDDFVNECMDKLNRYGDEKLLILQVLCTISRHHPGLPGIGINKYRLQLNVLQMLKDACDTRKTPYRIGVALDSLTELLHNFPLTKETLAQNLYTCLRVMCTSLNFIDQYKGLAESVITLLAQHMQQLEAFICEDYNLWHDFLKTLTRHDTLASLARDALRIFYKLLVESLKRGQIPESQDVVESFQKNFVESLTSRDENPQDLRTAIMGYSHMAELLKAQDDGTAVEKMFFLISRRTVPLYFTEDDHINFGDIVEYQETLARILTQLPDVTGDHMRIINKMCVLTIKKYPELKAEDQSYAGRSLKITIEHMSHLKVHFFEEFLSNIVSEGIAWTCSHPLLIDAELSRDQENSQRRPITYKDYIPLWKSLLASENYTLNNQEKVSTELLTTCINLTSKLDVRIKTREDNVFSDIALSQMPENEDDFRIFVNLVDLYDELLPDIINESSEIVKKLLESLIESSNTHPLVSGFYRLVKRLLRVVPSFSASENAFIVEYLRKTLKFVFEFSHELQISCIHLLLEIPKDFARDFLPHVAPVFTLAFRIGLNNYELADKTLENLERFVTWGDEGPVRALLLDVLPSLEVYLRSRESLEVYDNVEAPVKRISTTESALELLQNKILIFFGKVTNSVTFEFLHNQSQNTGGTWDSKDLLEYTMTFPEENLPVHLDTILPRVIELSLRCSDSRTRIAACETLHSIVIIVLGKNVEYISNAPDRYVSSYKILCPVLLKLGCDPDEVIWQIFNPLMLQMTHWLSSKLMLHSPAIGYLIDSLFDGLSDDSNSSIKDFSGICLAEFCKWSIKQDIQNHQRKIPLNILQVVENIRNFALHPLKSLKIASAIAFNHIYKILREDEQIVDTFWVEFLHCFVEAMDNCDDPRIRDALSHVARVLLEKSGVFRASSSRRRVPMNFPDGSLKSCVDFLLNRCINNDSSARKKCMELYERLREKIEGGNEGQYLGIQTLMLKRLNESETITSGEGLRCFIAVLDVYIWFLQRKFIEPKVLFHSNCQGTSSIFSFLQKFIREIDESPEDANIPVAVIKLLDLLVEILPIELSNREDIHNVLFGNKFCRLIHKCIRDPETLGFDVKSLEMKRILPEKMERLVKSLIKDLSATKMQMLFITLKSYFDDLLLATDVQDLSPARINQVKDKLESLITMKRCGLLEALSMDQIIMEKKLVVLKLIFREMKRQEGTRDWCRELTPEMKFHFTHLLELCLDDEGFSWLVKSKAQQIEKLLESEERSQMTHGEYFFITFRETFIRFLLRNIEISLRVIVEFARESPDFILFIINETALWLQRNKRQHKKSAEDFADAAISYFDHLHRILKNVGRRKNILKNIYRTVVRLKQNPVDIKVENKKMHYWILQEFSRSHTIPEKTQLLEDFLIYLVNDSGDDTELRVLFRTFDHLQVSRDSKGVPTSSLETTKFVQYFQTLVRDLPITKSLVVFEAVTISALKLGKYAENSSASDHLASYFTSIPHEKALNSLQMAHEIFLDASWPGDRLEALRYFLLPIFKRCPESVLNDFFENKIESLIWSVFTELPKNPQDRRLALISKFEAFSLLEVMFSSLDIATINHSSGPIATKVSEVTGQTSEVLIQVFRKVLDIRKMPIDPNDSDLSRSLHCAAFNCAVTMVTVSKETRYFQALFGENPRKDQLLWERIIDCSKSYSLTQTFKNLPKQRKFLVSIRETLGMEESSSSPSFLRSYNLASSTLTEDLAGYDMHGVIPLAEPSTPKLSVTLEDDELNDHECMAPIVGFLKFAFASHQGEEPPPWFQSFTGAMAVSEINVKLFLLKVILNTQEEFKRFRKLMVNKIVMMIYYIIKRSTFSYIIADALLMLVKWAEVSVPGDDVKGEVNKMFDLLVSKVEDKVSFETILKYNYSILQLLVKAWHEVLEPPSCLPEMMKVVPKGVRILFLLLQNGLGPKLVRDEAVLEFLLKALETWQKQEEPLLQTSAAIGLFLKFAAPQDPECQQRDTAIERIKEGLRKTAEPNRKIKCVHAMCTSFPGLLYELYQFVSHNHLKISAPTKKKSMELFLLRIPRMSDVQLTEELTHIKFQDLLENKVLSCEKICLEIILTLVTRLSGSALLPLAHLASNYSRHNDLDYRTLVYDIFMSIFKKYINVVTSQDNSAETLIDLSQKILLTGILDPSESLQNKCITFWTEEIKFRDSCPGRLLDILDEYSNHIAHDCLPIFALLFLQLSKKSHNYESQLFRPLDSTCSYKTYKIATSWRMKNLSYRIPLFVSSYASQYSQRFTLASLSSGDTDSSDDLMIRATNPLEFEPTLPVAFLTESNPEASTSDNIFAVPAIPTNFSRRFVASKSSTRHSYLQNRQEFLRQQTMKQRDSIKLSRGYRNGDLPDIAITHAAILNPLQELMKKDPLTCKNFMISMISAVIQGLQNHRNPEKKKSYSEFIHKVSEKFEHVFMNYHGGDLIVSAALEIILKNPGLSFDSKIVAGVAKLVGEEELGALLVERKLMNEIKEESLLEEPSSKRPRLENDENPRTENWVHLGELYESINDLDVLLSVFRNHVPGEDLNLASEARGRDSWEEAASHYERGIISERGGTRRHCRRGLVECLARLSDWEKLSEVVHRENTSLLQVLEDPVISRTGWMSDWYFRAQIYQSAMDSESSKEFLEQLKVTVNTEKGRRLVEDRFPEELALIHHTNMSEHAKSLIQVALRKSRDRWTQLSPLSVQLRLQVMTKLRTLCDTKLYRDCLVDLTRGSSDTLQALIDYWERSLPSPEDDSLSWDIHLARRTHVTEVLRRKLTGNCDNTGHSDKLLELEILQKMAFIKLAYCQKNPALMTKYMMDVKDFILETSNQLQIDFQFNRAQICFLRGQLGNAESKVKNFNLCKKKSESLVREGVERISVDTAIENLQLMVDWCSEMKNLKNENESSFNRIISKLIESSSYLPSEIDLEEYPLELLRRSISLAVAEPTPKRLQKCHLNLLKYCHRVILDQPGNQEAIKIFVESTLRAIGYGSNEATSYFPCILTEDYLGNDEIKRVFKEATEGIPTWKFLRWQPQLFIHLKTSLRPSVVPIIERLARDYPNALFSSLQSTKDVRSDLKNDPLVQELSLKFSQDLKDFAEALEYLVRPELYLMHHLDELAQDLHLGTDFVVDRLLAKVYHPRDPSMRGNIYKYISTFEEEVLRIKDMSPETIEEFVKSLKRRLNSSLTRNKDSDMLRDYSPYLSRINGSSLEIPGACSGESDPDSRYRPKIVKIEEKIQVMKSLRKPIRMRIIGDDTKSYNFLLKFGEDLRGEQRLQQTFNVINEVLRRDLSCSHRNLFLKTLKVIPLSRRLGLIEWIGNARTLQEFVEFTWSESQRGNVKLVDKNYEQWINESSDGEERREVRYREAVLRRSSDETIRKMKSLMSMIDGDALRRTFLTINPSAQGFVTARRNFIVTYAVMSLVQWVLGIGDRHLGNTMVQVESGKCTGIDFASVFGGGVQQAIPELMPLRLTNQILRLMEPFDQGDLVAATMGHVLEALRHHSDLISGVLGPIVRDRVNQTPQGRRDQWVSTEKLRVVLRKLGGDHPAAVMLDELRAHHFEEETLVKYEAVVRGESGRAFRSTVADTCLTTEVQIKCLLEQATDLNVLGRTYVGWRPYV
ncbi:DNA-dependent protein kinase catalytic subunit-like [Fopius arisanus]|uniref:non-specific serine/threonine protein kinase n=1 Tax=Fopius arisanus TaxID=64838 RepID=A0A9R1SV92_9HYME|nr:PREDICTED: DNA-dependent protein kinase catalytic subunit-like [Fopius arisanus]